MTSAQHLLTRLSALRRLIPSTIQPRGKTASLDTTIHPSLQTPPPLHTTETWHKTPAHYYPTNSQFPLPKMQIQNDSEWIKPITALNTMNLSSTTLSRRHPKPLPHSTFANMFKVNRLQKQPTKHPRSFKITEVHYHDKSIYLYQVQTRSTHESKTKDEFLVFLSTLRNLIADQILKKTGGKIKLFIELFNKLHSLSTEIINDNIASLVGNHNSEHHVNHNTGKTLTLGDYVITYTLKN